MQDATIKWLNMIFWTPEFQGFFSLSLIYTKIDNSWMFVKECGEERWKSVLLVYTWSWCLHLHLQTPQEVKARKVWNLHWHGRQCFCQHTCMVFCQKYNNTSETKVIISINFPFLFNPHNKRVVSTCFFKHLLTKSFFLIHIWKMKKK